MQEQTTALHAFFAKLNAEADLASVAVDAVSEQPVSAWGDAFAAHPEWVSFGPLNALLELAHAQLDNDAARARDIAAFALARAREIAPSDDDAVLRPLLLGTAHKELANALAELHDYAGAMTEVCQAIDIFRQEPAFAVDRAVALLTYAQVAHEQNETVGALEAVDEAAKVFLSHHETRRYLQALEVCGHILFDQEEYAAAREIFETARTVAERLDDPYDAARLELNLGQTLIHLEALDEATHYLTKALTYFEEIRMAGAVYRAVWGIARIARERGELDKALEACHLVYGEFLHRGRHRAAAAVLVELGDTVTALTGDPAYARELCQQLAQSMGKYDVPGNVRDAVVYLQRAAEDTSSASRLQDAFGRVRKYLDTLIGSPLAAFAAES